MHPTHSENTRDHNFIIRYKSIKTLPVAVKSCQLFFAASFTYVAVQKNIV